MLGLTPALSKGEGGIGNVAVVIVRKDKFVIRI